MNQNLQANNLDRFIPLRIPSTATFSHSPPAITATVDDFDGFCNYAKVRFNEKNYKRALREILMPLDTKPLNFFPPRNVCPPQPHPMQETWPVKSRKKPVIGPPDVVLDMPELDSNPYHHVIDWSKSNCLATIHRGEAHMWWTEFKPRRDQTETGERIQNCIRWKGAGTQLAVGLAPNRLGVLDISSKKLVFETFCCVPFCEVLCMEWVGDFLFTGCSGGVLRMKTTDLKRVKAVKATQGKAVVKIVSSCNQKFLATSSQDKSVMTWKIPELEAHTLIQFGSVVTALAWHPWKHSLLAVGVGEGKGRVQIFNVGTSKQLACEKAAYQNSSVNCLTFNPISAELVVSYHVTCDEDRGIIAVLSNIDEVVEELHIHKGSIPYLLWDKDGKTLASVCSDENLRMWRFFGSQEKSKKSVKKSDSFDKFREYIR